MRIYIDSWNASFGELLSQADRTVTPELVARWRRDLSRPVPHRWWVAERSGSIVGGAGIGPSRDPVDPSIGELDSIFVAILWTVAGYRQGIAFYEALGWRRDGGIRDHGRQLRFRRVPKHLHDGTTGDRKST